MNCPFFYDPCTGLPNAQSLPTSSFNSRALLMNCSSVHYSQLANEMYPPVLSMNRLPFHYQPFSLILPAMNHVPVQLQHSLAPSFASASSA
jgi:hypothetical protein